VEFGPERQAGRNDSQASNFVLRALHFKNGKQKYGKECSRQVIYLCSCPVDGSVLKFDLDAAALSMTMSGRDRAGHLCAKDSTDSYESMSRGQTSILAFGCVRRCGATALSPFSTVRAATMTCKRCKSRKTRAVSSPMPTLLPVMIATWPARDVDGGGGLGFVRTISTNLMGERDAEVMAQQDVLESITQMKTETRLRLALVFGRGS